MEFAKKRARLNAEPLCAGYWSGGNERGFLLLGDVLAVQPWGGKKTDFINMRDGRVIEQLEGEVIATLGPDAALIMVGDGYRNADVYMALVQGGSVHRTPLGLKPGHVCLGGCGNEAGVIALSVTDRSRPVREWEHYIQLVDASGDVVSTICRPGELPDADAMSPCGRYLLAIVGLGKTYEGRVYDCAHDPPEIVFRGNRGGLRPVMWLPSPGTRRFLAQDDFSDCSCSWFICDIDSGDRSALLSGAQISLSGVGALSPDGELLPLWPEPPEDARGAIVMRWKTGEMMHTGIIHKGRAHVPFVWAPSSRKALIQHVPNWYDPATWTGLWAPHDVLSVMDLDAMEITELDLDAPVGEARIWLDENRFVFIGGFLGHWKPGPGGKLTLSDDHIYLADLSEAVPI